MAGKFNAKFFNGEVFQKYIDRIPNPRKTELLKSRAIRGRPELASSMRDEVGGNYISTPLKGLISGSVPMNYDGNTDITPSSTETFMQSRVVVGRANAWAELDFSYDITGGEDFMENVAEQINDYWNEIDQDTLVAILKGVFSMTDTQGKKFVTTHTHDVTALLNADGKTGVMDATTMNTAIQRASGDQKGKFTLVLMHSVVATNLENLKLLTYLKYNDADGMQRDIGLATLNGRLVLVDDSMPVEHGYDAATPALRFSSGWSALPFLNTWYLFPPKLITSDLSEMSTPTCGLICADDAQPVRIAAASIKIIFFIIVPYQIACRIANLRNTIHLLRAYVIYIAPLNIKSLFVAWQYIVTRHNIKPLG